MFNIIDSLKQAIAASANAFYNAAVDYIDKFYSVRPKSLTGSPAKNAAQVNALGERNFDKGQKKTMPEFSLASKFTKPLAHGMPPDSEILAELENEPIIFISSLEIFREVQSEQGFDGYKTSFQK